MEIRQIYNIFKRWLWLLILVPLIAGAVGYYRSNQETPLYQASTRFAILGSAVTSFDYVYYANVDHQQLIQTYSQLLSTEALFERASEILGYSAYGAGASAAQIGDSQFMRLTVTHTDPVKSAEIANVLIGVLIEQNEELQSVRYRSSETNIQQRADQALVQIESLQAEIEAIADTTVEEQIRRAEARIDELQPQVIDLQAQINELQTSIAAYDPLFASEEAAAQHLAQQRTLAEYQAEVEQLKLILSQYQQIYTSLVVMEEPVMGSSTMRGVEARLQSNLSLYQQIYINSIRSLESLSMSQAQLTPNVIQLEPATAPGAPFSPRPMQNATLYASMGLVAAAGLAFMVEYLDDTLKTPEDVKNVLGLPVVGLVADIPNGGGKTSKKSKTQVFVANQPRSPITEAFRSLRTNLDFASVDEPIKTLMITSSSAEEGKTTISSNLAVVMAFSGKRVLLLDADMRRPAVHNQFNISNRVGLSDLIRKRLNYSEVMQVSEEIPNLFVITSGSLPHNPSELLTSKRMEQIISHLNAHFDIVIIDTPPLLVTDAHVLSAKVDGVLLVIRPGKTRATIVRAPLEELHRLDANLVGVVMNRIPRNKESYYGGFKYYSPYTKDDHYHHSESAYEIIDPAPFD